MVAASDSETNEEDESPMQSSTLVLQQEIMQGLLSELQAPEPSEKEFIGEETEESEIEPLQASEKLAQLYLKAYKAEEQMIIHKHKEILRWYYYAKEFESRVDETVKKEKISDRTARNKIYNEIRGHLSSDKMKRTIRDRTYRARKIYKLFEAVGIDKIERVTYSPSSIAKLNVKQIEEIINIYMQEQ